MNMNYPTNPDLEQSRFNQFPNMNQMNYYNQQPQRTNLPTTDNILFVADLPEETCEEDLTNFFKTYNMLFVKVIHSAMRTHAFVHFASPSDAQKARMELNGVKISAKYSSTKMSKPIRLCKYEAKSSQATVDPRCNLLVKNISKEISSHGLFNLFIKYGDIRSSKLVLDYLGNSKGYGYVSYYKAEDAVRAQTDMNNREVNGKFLKVTHLERGRATEKKKNNIYVKHIPIDNFDNEDLENLFGKFGEIKSAVVLKDQSGKSKGFGFVCFNDSEDAEKAYKEMHNKNLWKDLPALYVNFALKKGERQEQLMKEREEMFKQAQKMTVFVKVKDESTVEDEHDFENQIIRVLRTFLNKEYKPRSLKIKFDSKTAFITMNSQREAEEFVRKFQEYSRQNPSNLFFNIYKSKVERVTAKSYFKNYNFNATQVPTMGPGMGDTNQPKSRYKNYNELPPSNNFPYSTINQEVPKRSYNSFNFAPETQPQRPMYQQYNQFPSAYPQPVQTPVSVFPPLLTPVDQMDKEDLAEYIFHAVEKIYPGEGGKIAGMLLEIELYQFRKLVSGEQEQLLNTIHKAHRLLNPNK